MADFADMQAKFDADPALGKRFLSDPVGVLAAHGVTLAPQQAFNLQQSVSEVTQPSAVTTKAEARVSISIGITIRF